MDEERFENCLLGELMGGTQRSRGVTRNGGAHLTLELSNSLFRLLNLAVMHPPIHPSMYAGRVVERQTDPRVSGCMHACMHERTDACMHTHLHSCMHGWMDGLHG